MIASQPKLYNRKYTMKFFDDFCIMQKIGDKYQQTSSDVQQEKSSD